jgi:DNA polymerase III epsilon subunit-like protein
VFKLHNPLVVFDLEATVRTNEKGHSVHDEILDLGAVFLDQNLKPQGEFSSLVQVRTPLNDFITRLTGIKPQDLEGQPTWPEVASRFLDWVQQLAQGKLKQVRLCTWGSSFDITLLRRQFEDLNKEFPFSGTVIDVKSLCFLRQSLAGERTDKLDMDQLAKSWGLSQPEKRHRALPDAQLTAQLLLKVWSDLQGFWISQAENKPWLHCQVLVTP